MWAWFKKLGAIVLGVLPGARGNAKQGPAPLLPPFVNDAGEQR